MSESVVFAHEKLKVYQRALAFFRLADEMAGSWDAKHAISDHLPRAAESIVLNLAEASAAFSGVKQKSLDVALGSTLECAACLDIAHVKELIDGAALALHKPSLARIFRMQMGLRKSWSGDVVREEPEAYGPAEPARQSVLCFHHEQLDVYRVALEFVGWFCGGSSRSRVNGCR
jgi:four helix bundle protein